MATIKEQRDFLLKEIEALTEGIIWDFEQAREYEKDGYIATAKSYRQKAADKVKTRDMLEAIVGSLRKLEEEEG